MTQKTSFVGGVISFAAVILLSILSLDTVEEGGFFMQEVFSSQVDAPPSEGDSIDGSCIEEILR